MMRDAPGFSSDNRSDPHEKIRESCDSCIKWPDSGCWQCHFLLIPSAPATLATQRLWIALWELGLGYYFCLFEIDLFLINNKWHSDHSHSFTESGKFPWEQALGDNGEEKVPIFNSQKPPSWPPLLVGSHLPWKKERERERLNNIK